VQTEAAKLSAVKADANILQHVARSHSRCGKLTAVPKPSEPPADAVARLVENESQRTEVTGYINQFSIQ